MGKVVEQTACPNCDSSDAFTVYSKEDGTLDGYCYSCKAYVRDPYKDHQQADASKEAQKANPLVGSFASSSPSPTKVYSLDEALVHPIREIKDRGISFSTCEHYGVRVGVDTRDGTTPVYHLYPVYKDGELSGFKQRICKNKSFQSIGDTQNVELFGSHVVKPTGKKLFITEGEIDCLSLYQVLKENSGIDWDPAVVSLPHGCASATKSIIRSMELINGYEQIILIFDNDAPGKTAQTEVCKLLAGKVYTARIKEKDPNEMLLKGKGTDLKWAALTGAKKYQPDGVLNAADCWERYKHEAKLESFPYPDTMQGLNNKMYGVRPGSIVTVTSGSGCGKTQFLRELKYHYLMTTEAKIADIALEEDVGDTIGGLLSIHMNKRITLPDVKISEEEERKAFDDIFSSGRITLYDYFGGMDDDNLFSKLRYFTSTGHKFIFLDHLSIIVSEYASEGGERERIDTIMTKLAKLVKETGAIIFLVVHLRKSDSSTKSFEQGTIPSLDDLRGSGAIKQLSWDVIGLSRNQQHKDVYCANTTELTVLKCRFTGRTGNAGYLYFDDNTGRMIQTEEPVGYRDRRLQ